MNETLAMTQGSNGTFQYNIENQQKIVQTLQHGTALTNVMQTVNGALNHQLKQHSTYLASMENMNQRYWDAETSRQVVINNEVGKYDQLLDTQNNLLNRINYPEIRFWRYKNQLYYRANSGQLIIDNHIEVQKELSSRYGPDVYIVYDMNDVLKNNSQIRVNTVFIAVNCLPVVDQEIVEPNSKYELLQYCDGTFKRNLLAHTRYMQNRLLYNKTSDTFTKKVMSCMTERNSDCISPWIKDIGTENDTILLLVGNKTLSEDLVVDKVIKRLFNTGIVVTLTDDMSQKQMQEDIVNGKLFLHINNIPKDEENRKKLKDLLISIVINKSVISEGNTIPTQVKVIVTIDEADSFFKNLIEITKTLFIDTEENILLQLGLDSMVPVYKAIENSLNCYSYEIASMVDKPLDLYKNDNKRYLELVSEENTIEELSNSDDFQVLDPCDDFFKRFFPIAEYHTYITGLTRIGKSSFLITLFIYYIQNLKANVILFDVHGDLAKKAKMLVKDKERLLYISNSLDKSYAASINLFIIDDKSEKNIMKIANIIFGVLKQIKVDESFSGAMEEALLRCIRVLLRKGNGDFYELYRFMNDKRNSDLVQYAKKCGNTLDEEYFSDYFNDTNTKNAIRRRLGTLLSDEDFMNMMSGNDKCIDFEKEFNTPGKIIIIDIAKGDMDSYTYYIRFIVEYILVLALKRVKTPKGDRVRTHLILDEFDNFISSNNNIKTILKEAGKYNLLLTMAHQITADIKDSSLKDTISSMTVKKVIFRNSNKTVVDLEKTLNKKIDVESLNKGECLITVDNELVKGKNTTRFLDDTEEISDIQWKETKQYQLTYNYRPINQTISQPTEDEFNQMLQQFKNDFTSKNLMGSSCLHKLNVLAPERLKEIKSDLNHIDLETNVERPRIRQQELSTIFQLAFELNDSITNRKFIQILKVEDKDDMFNQTSSGSRLGNFTDDGASKTGQYYYFEW